MVRLSKIKMYFMLQNKEVIVNYKGRKFPAVLVNQYAKNLFRCAEGKLWTCDRRGTQSWSAGKWTRVRFDDIDRKPKISLREGAGIVKANR